MVIPLLSSIETLSYLGLSTQICSISNFLSLSRSSEMVPVQ